MLAVTNFLILHYILINTLTASEMELIPTPPPAPRIIFLKIGIEDISLQFFSPVFHSSKSRK